jgi:hypothetical protein
MPLMKGKKTELKFEEGMGGSIEMRVSRATWGACPRLFSTICPLPSNGRSLYPFGNVSNLRVRLRVRQPASFRAGSEITLLYQRKLYLDIKQVSTK